MANGDGRAWSDGAGRTGRRALASVCAIALALALVGPASRGVAQETAQETPLTVDSVLLSMTRDELVGQLVLVNFVDADASPASDIAGLVRDFKAGAVILQAVNRNIVNSGDTAGQVAALTNGLQQRAYDGTARADGSYLPLFIAVDNEGDLYPFTNVRNGYTQLPNNMTIGATWSKAHAQAAGAVAGRELSAAGINMLLGPVVDVLETPRSGGSGDIGIRSFGGNAAWVGELGRAYVRGVHEGSGGRMMTVAKHFPGHGASDRATDDEVPTVNKPLDLLRESDLAPFAELLREDASDPQGTTDAMMVSHIRYQNFVTGAPASFTSPISIDAPAFRTLMQLPEFAPWRRDHMVMADSLGVKGIREWYAVEERASVFPTRDVARDALLAGNDLLPLVEFFIDPTEADWRRFQLPVIQDTIVYMRGQYDADPVFRQRVNEAARRVIAAKLALYPNFTLDEVLVDPAQARAAAGGGAEEMRALADDALTLLWPASIEQLRGRLGGSPAAGDKIVIVQCWRDCFEIQVVPREQMRNQLLALYGPDGAGRVAPEDVTTVTYAELEAWIDDPDAESSADTARALEEARWIILALTEYNPLPDYPAADAVRRFLDRPPIDVRNKYLVAVAYHAPYHLDGTQISKLSAYFAVYQKTDYAIDTSLRALFGDLDPKGNSPVNVGGVFYDVSQATQPDPAQELRLQVYGFEPDAVPAARAVGLVAGPIVDRNGNPVPDGTNVSFTLTPATGAVSTATAVTVDGMAGASLAASGAGSYSASASVNGIASAPLSLTLMAEAPAEPTAAPDASAVDGEGGDGISPLLLALVVGVPSAAGLAVAGGGALVLARRRASRRRAAEAAPAPEPALPPETAPVPLLRVDADTRRVFVKGAETQVSHDQFELLSYLYDRAGKAVSRDELVRHVWPDDHAEGVSEEALDALVRRVRERIVQAGGERGYIVTLRGQGFRLEI